MVKDTRLAVPAKEPVILVVGDTHFPFVDEARLRTVYEVAKAVNPTHIVQIGDLFDLYTFSRFSRSVDFITPKQELEEGRAMAGRMWATFAKISPKSLKYQLRGNHEARLLKSLLAKAPEYESLVESPLSMLNSFPGVIDMKTGRSELEIGTTLLIHGWSCRPGVHMAYFGQSVICGHTHHGGVIFKAVKGSRLFELNCGHLADVDQLPLQYGETKTTSWVAGCGVVDKYGPRFIAL